MPNILITSAGRRVSLVRAFKKELDKYFSGNKVLTADMNPDLSAACRVSDYYFKVPPVTDPSYCRILSDICKSNNIKLIIPTIDTELAILSNNIGFFKDSGITAVISDTEVIDLCRDKHKTHSFFDEIEFPRCMEVDLNNPHFPVFSKPFDGSSSIGIRIIRNEDDLHAIKDYQNKMMFLEYLDPKDFKEFTIDLYFDRMSRLKCAVPRQRIEVRTGEVSKAVTVRDELYRLVCSKFSYCKGFRGCITLQVFRNNSLKDVYGIEINPRFGGGYPLSYIAKANYPEMIIMEYFMDEEIPFFESWIQNLLMLRYDDEIIVNDYKG